MPEVNLSPFDDENDEERGSRWAALLDSKAVVALITAVFAAFIAPTITWIIETKAAEREFNAAWLKARGDLALETHRDSITQKRQVIEQIASGIDRLVTASRALVTSTTFPDQNVPQVAEIIHEFNEAEKAWNRTKLTVGFRLLYYSAGSPDVDRTWRTVDQNTYQFAECVSTWYDGFLRTAAVPSNAEAICGEQRNRLVDAMMKLGAQSYTNLDAGWNTPDELKKSLGLN